MAVSLKHKKTVTGTSNPKAQINPPEWNDEHALTGSPNTMLGFDGAGNAIERSPIFISVKDHGAKGDGTTDDTAAIQAALNAAAAFATGSAAGGVVFLPAGQHPVSSQIVVPQKVRLVGANKRSSILKASANFPVSTPVVRLGDGSGIVFDCRVEDLAIYCSDIAGSTGIYSTGVQEGSGARDVLISGYMSYGINFEDHATDVAIFIDHFQIEDVEAYCSASAVGSTGLRINYQRNGGLVRRFTAKPNGGPVQAVGIHLRGTDPGGSHVQLSGINIESHTDGILIDTDAGATIQNAALLTAGTNLVRIVSARPVAITSLFKGVGTNAVKNDLIGHNITDGRVPSYVTSWSNVGYQVFTAAGRLSTDGNVVSNDVTTFTVKSLGAAGTGASLSGYALLDVSNDGWLIRNGVNATDDPIQFFPYAAGALGTLAFSITDTGVANSLLGFNVAGLQILRARKIGWVRDTGTAKRTANATYVGTAEAAYTQVTIQALMDSVRDLSQTMKALKDDLHSDVGHGLIGA